MKRKNNRYIADNLREIVEFLLHGQFCELFLTPTENSLLQFFRYCFVGGIASVVDWSAVYLVEKMGAHYLFAAVIGFFCGLLCNYGLSKAMVFRMETSKFDSRREFLAYGFIGVIGLLLTLIIMYILTEWFHIYFMISKIAATVLVLFWNFMARKYWLY
ncbi:MAG: GtrA family protein [Lachnospiraceae bacterium]